MDIQEIRGSESELSHVPLGSTITCSGCAADVLLGDRFCQECGTRISINRARKTSNRERTASLYPEGTASVICFNCGTTNQALSKVCSDCKLTLVTESPAQSNSGQGGLRGSIANKTKPQEDHTNRKRSGAGLESKTEKAVVTSPIPYSGTNHSGPDGSNRAGSRSFEREAVGVVEKNYDSVYKKSTEPSHREALDYLFSTESKNRASIFGSFDKLLSESRTIRNVFSLTAFVVLVESFFERVPTPLVFLVTSLTIVIATVNATTQWNRHEQRLQALDKIAANAEENMRRYDLDLAIRTLRELDRTEKGDLPPRPRAVLNQCLWLRSYKLTKEKQYGRALKDLSRVTSDFVSYDDVREKKLELEKLLESHPEFSGDRTPVVAVRTGQKRRTKESVSSSPRRLEPVKTAVARLEGSFETRSASSPNLSKAGASSRPVEDGLEGVDLTLEKTKAKDPEPTKTGSRSSKKTVEIACAQKTGMKSAKGNLPDHDMKRYSDLLVDYFSRAESGCSEGEQITEPPSFEEWVHSGKGDF